MENQYKIVFSGELLPGFTQQEVVENLVTMTSMDTEKAEKFLSVDKPSLVKKDLTLEQAEKYCALLQKAGAKVRMTQPEQPQPKAEPTPPAPEKTVSQRAEPKVPGSENPYASPRADLKVDKASSDDWLGEPAKVSPGRGVHWIKQAVSMFFAQPWKWVGMSLIVMLVIFPVNMIPFVGFIPYTILAMIFGGGLMLAAKSQADGETIEFGYVFKGFTHNRNQLVVVGLLYLAGFMAIGFIMAMIMGAGIWGVMGVGGGDPEAASAAMVQNMPLFFLTMLFGLALSIPLMMAMWFATPLVAINDQTAWTACKLSLRGCLRNWVAFLVYGIVFFVISGIAMAIFGGGMALLTFLLGGENSILFALLPFVIMVLAMFPLMIITGISVFTGYHDIYYKKS